MRPPSSYSSSATASFASGQPGRDTTFTAPDFTSVTITRDAYGVPHISAATEVGLFYGQGYAVAEDRYFQMESIRRVVLGLESEIYGPSSLADDRATRTLIYTDAERTAQFNALSTELKAALTAYKDGVNAYIANVVAEPAKFKPIEFQTLNIPVEDYTVEDLLAIVQGFLRGFGGNGGDELTRLQELTTLGQAAFDAMYPINDPTAPTTIPSGPTAASKVWQYTGPSVTPEAAAAVAELQDRALSGLPKWGSFAAIIAAGKSNSGNVMLLGGPQMGPPVVSEPSRTLEVELISPTIHVGGMTVVGAPGVIIGHNEHYAWTLTSAQSDNQDVFIESTNAGGTQYLYNSVMQNFDTIVDNIPVLGQADDVFAHFRTVHGPVIGADVPNQQAFSVQSTYWGEEMNMHQGLYDIWKGSTLADFEAGVAQITMSFNVFFAGEDTGPGTQTIKYWHAGKYQDRTDGVDPRLPHVGIGTEEWGGFIPFANLPQADGATQNYFVNWNNKPEASWDQGDNMPWIVGNVFRDRVNNLDAAVGPTTPFSFADLTSVTTSIGDRGTYTQAIEISTSASAAAKTQAVTFTDENLNPPGQSGFISTAQDTSAHFYDQWALHESYSLKDMEFSSGGLPVELVDIRTIVDGERVTLIWDIASESNNAGFEVQHRTEARDRVGTALTSDVWQVAGFVEGRGTASTPKRYAYPVSDLSVGTHDFRLRQIDLDGTSVYSPTVTALVGLDGQLEILSIYPNPADEVAALSFVAPEGREVTIEVFDMLGRRVAVAHRGSVRTAEATQINVGTSRLPSGIYSAVARSGDAVQRRSFTVVH